MTKKQLKELKCLNYFIHEDKTKITNEDVKMFFDYSERGVKPKEITKGYQLLIDRKRRRDIHIGMYEEGNLDGTFPYCEFKAFPKFVVEYFAKNMFEGIDYNIIMKYE